MSIVSGISTGQAKTGISVNLIGFIVLSIVAHGLLLLINEHQVKEPNPVVIGNRVLSISLPAHKQENHIQTSDNKVSHKNINTGTFSKNSVRHEKAAIETSQPSKNNGRSENNIQVVASHQNDMQLPGSAISNEKNGQPSRQYKSPLGVMATELVNKTDAQIEAFDPDQQQTLQRNYLLGEIHHRLSQFLAYPDHARRRGWQGSVMIGFAVDKQGFLRDIHLTRTSGYNMLDSAALTAIKKVNSIPVNQWGNRFQPVVLQLPIIYQLTNS